MKKVLENELVQRVQLSKANGIISYIAKNQWLNSAAASNMRKIMYENTHIDKIIDFGTNMIFENVGQQTMIFFLTKNSHNQEHQIDFIKFKNKITNIEIISILFNDIENENIEISTKILPKIYDEKENLTFSSDVNELSPLNKQVKFTQVV